MRECLFPQPTRSRSQPILSQPKEDRNDKQTEANQLIINLQNFLSQTSDIQHAKRNFIEAIKQFDPTLNQTQISKNSPTYKLNNNANRSLEH